MNESLIKYLAGLLDADGSLSFWFKADPNRPGRNYIRIQLRLSSSEAVDTLGFIETLPEQTGMGVVTREGSRKQFKNWVVTKRADLEMLLPRLTKHMVIKAKHWNWLFLVWRKLRENSKTVSDVEMQALKDASKASRRETVGPLKPKNHPTWAWLAGYLDGDGSYYCRKHKGSWLIRVSAVAHENDKSVLEFLQKAFAGRIYAHGQSPNVWVWARSLGKQSRSFALSFLPNLAKHSRLKRHKINAIIHHHRQRLSVQGVREDVSDSLRLSSES